MTDEWDFAFEDEEDAFETDDPDGWEAFRLGADNYNKGMDCIDPEQRIHHFQTAEKEYLRAYAKGNIVARLCLGYIYAYDRCEGRYAQVSGAQNEGGNASDAFSVEEQACNCFKDAAVVGLPEGCYKYGDMLKEGRGCKKDPEEAFRQFQRGYDLGRDQHPVIWGSSALRIATCYEEGSGTEQNFSKALSWYMKAEAGLDIAVREGESWHKGRLKQARSGIVRMKQEISGAY